MFSLRNQESVVADSPRVLLSRNYVMYDRWVSYSRFNSYFKYDTAYWETEEDERQYYNRNVLNFLVLKFNRKIEGTIGNNDIILFDANFKNLYNLGDPFRVAYVDVSDCYNDFCSRTFPVARIIECSSEPIPCFGLNEDGRWCKTLSITNNGYCDEHQDQSNEFEDVDVDRLLTLGELMNLPEFYSLRYMNLHVDREDDND